MTLKFTLLYMQIFQKGITKKQGFTIVELLIVIVVIAILAAISVVAYNGIQNRSNDAAVSFDISTIRKKLELVKVDLGHYPQALSQFPSDFKFSKSVYDPIQNNVYYITDTVNDTYALGLRSKSLKGFILTNSGIQENVNVAANATATAISVTWGGAGTWAVQGYNSTGVWSASWSWTN
jgi:prepilin-type N-terminal cleavage/methylation domain-containing protein